MPEPSSDAGHVLAAPPGAVCFTSLCGTRLFEDLILGLLAPKSLACLGATSRALRTLIASLPRSTWAAAFSQDLLPQHPVFRAADIPAYLAAQCRIQRNFRLGAGHPVHQPERLQLGRGAVLSHSEPFQVAATFTRGGEGVLTLRWARAKVAHLRAQLPPLPEGLAFSRLHFSPGDNYLLLLLDSPAERFQLPGGAQSVPVCVVDLKEQRLTTWQVPQPRGVLRLPFLGWSPSGCCFMVSHVLPPEAAQPASGAAAADHVDAHARELGRVMHLLDSCTRPGSRLCAFTAGGQLVGSKRARSIKSPIWSPCGQMMAATEYLDRPTLWVWRPGTGESTACAVPRGHSEDVLTWSICSRWLLLSNPGSKVARFFSAAPVAELGSQTLCAEMARASWSLQGVAVLHQDWQAGLQWDLTQCVYETNNLESEALDMRPVLIAPIASRSLCHLVGPVSSPDGLLVAFTMRKSAHDGTLDSCTLVVNQVQQGQLSGPQKTYDVGFEAEGLHWASEGSQLIVNGATEHIILRYELRRP